MPKSANHTWFVGRVPLWIKKSVAAYAGERSNPVRNLYVCQIFIFRSIGPWREGYLFGREAKSVVRNVELVCVINIHGYWTLGR